MKILIGFIAGILVATTGIGGWAVSYPPPHFSSGLEIRIKYDPTIKEDIQSSYHLVCVEPGDDWHEWIVVSWKSEEDAIKASRRALTAATFKEPTDADSRIPVSNKP